ncbi:MAG TPA: hypothetical protein VMX17_15520 [Candidatus Glassbacteria bacterium]|nr:hypothetical protein [Candidatus Glassbacteria bacterium]
MADGETHDKYYEKGWIFIYPLSISLSVIIMIKISPILGVAFFPTSLVNYKLAKYITPDSDLMGLTIGEWGILRDWKEGFGWFGGLFATIWNAWWLVYAYISGKHRSWYSHGWGIGTVGRIIHFNIPILYFIFANWGYGIVALWSTPNFDFFKLASLMYLSSQFITWFIADAIHLILDTKMAKGVLYTPVKRRGNKSSGGEIKKNRSNRKRNKR